MGFVIDDPETEALAAELARIRGISPEEAIRISVIHALREPDAAEKGLHRTQESSDLEVPPVGGVTGCF